MNDGERDDLWVADADGERRPHAARLSRPVPLARRPRLVAGRQAHRLQPDHSGADGWGIGTLETVDVATGRVRVVLGPWKRDFTAGARYSPDGRQVVFEKVHKTGRGPDADIDGGRP